MSLKKTVTFTSVETLEITLDARLYDSLDKHGFDAYVQSHQDAIEVTSWSGIDILNVTQHHEGEDNGES